MANTLRSDELAKLLRHNLDVKNIFYDRRGLVDVWDIIRSRPFQEKVTTEKDILRVAAGNPEEFTIREKAGSIYVGAKEKHTLSWMEDAPRYVTVEPAQLEYPLRLCQVDALGLWDLAFEGIIPDRNVQVYAPRNAKAFVTGSLAMNRRFRGNTLLVNVGKAISDGFEFYYHHVEEDIVFTTEKIPFRYVIKGIEERQLDMFVLNEYARLNSREILTTNNIQPS